MAYSIEAAIRSKSFGRIIVSTDSKAYGKIAESYNAEVCYRSEELSNDTAATFDVMEDLMKRVHSEFDYFVLLQPTSPLRNEMHITEAIGLFESKSSQFDFLVSVKQAEHSADLVKRIDEDLSLKYFDRDFSNYKRQAYREYSPNGAIFIGKKNEYLKHKHFFGERSMAYIMNKEDSIDIDDILDFELAETVMERRAGIGN